MASPTPVSYVVPEGDRVYAGKAAPARDPALITFAWPPGTNCTIPDAEGVNAPIHPKVLDTGSPGFGGYRYWMAYTPYPGVSDTKENPCVVASVDGDVWVEPAANPIEPAPPGVANGYKYYADTHLALVAGVLYLFFILNVSTESYGGARTTTVYARATTDGLAWTAKQVVLSEVTQESVSLLSPSISYFNNEWWLWSYDSATVPIKCFLRKAPGLFGTWSAPVECSLVIVDSTREIWHFDVCRIPNGWAMLISDRTRSSKTKGRLWFAYSSDGVAWSARSSAFATTSPNVYRSSIVRNGTGFDCWITDWDARKIRRLRINDNQV